MSPFSRPKKGFLGDFMNDDLQVNLESIAGNFSISSAALIRLKQQERDEIKRQVEQFLANGGAIDELDVQESAFNKNRQNIPEGIKAFKNSDNTTVWRYMRDDGAWCGSYAQLHLAKIARAEWIKQNRKFLNGCGVGV